MSKKNVSITSKENDEELVKRRLLSHIDDAIDQTPITKIAKNAPLEHPKAINTEAFATKKHGFDILDEAINNTPITKIIKDGYESKKLEKTETIPYYRYVKNDQDALKSVIMAEFNLTEEMAKALSTELRMKALQLKNSQNSAPTLSLPEVAPELYDDRPFDKETGKRETPIQFYERVWKKYADGGVLFQDSLRKLDSKLVDAIHSYCQRNSLTPSEHLPPPKARRTELYASGNNKEAIKAQIALLKRQLQ